MNSLYDAMIAGTGKYVPKEIRDNHYFTERMDTSDEWITTRTGMKYRHIAAPGEASSDMALEAAKKALDAARMNANDLDMVVVGTISPDHMFPSTGCMLLKKLGIKDIPAFDLSAGCTGLIYALTVGAQFVMNGKAKNVLVIGVEILSRLINWQDRGTAILFGDGAGAVILSIAKNVSISKLIDTDLTADGTHAELLMQKAGGSKYPATEETVRNSEHTVYMEGNKIFKFAVRSMYDSCHKILKRNNIDISKIDWLIPHQANYRIIESLGKKLGIHTNRVIVTIDKYANTSSSTVPIALDDAIRSKKIRRGDLVLLVAFGAGLTSGSVLFRY